MRLGFAWELSELTDAKLQPGDELDYHLEASDNFLVAGAHHAPVPSATLHLTIISQDDLNKSEGE